MIVGTRNWSLFAIPRRAWRWIAEQDDKQNDRRDGAPTKREGPFGAFERMLTNQANLMIRNMDE